MRLSNFGAVASLAALAATASAELISADRLPLQTMGSKIVDKDGSSVRLACQNWFGAHMERHVVGGLDKVPIDEIAGQIASLGFNCIRLTYSLE